MSWDNRMITFQNLILFFFKAKKMISLSGIQNCSGWEWCLERHSWQNPLECRVLHVCAEASRKMEGICMRLENIILYIKKNWTSHALRGSFWEHQLSCFSGLWLKLKSKTGIFHLQSSWFTRKARTFFVNWFLSFSSEVWKRPGYCFPIKQFFWFDYYFLFLWR